MTITVNQPEKIGIPEGPKVEFKTSAFYAPGDLEPGLRQMRTIAETVAAFMNAEGGTLYIGVADDGTIRGIAGDLNVLAVEASSVALRIPDAPDEKYTYKGTADSYQLKLQHILQAFLSGNHIKYVKAIEVGRVSKTSHTPVCRVVVDKCAEDDFVYCREKKPTKPATEEIFVRVGNEKKMLQGRDRDEFVKDRWSKSMFVKLAEMRSRQPEISVDSLLEGIRALLERTPPAQTIVGEKIVVDGALPLTKKGLAPIKSPGGIVLDGRHMGAVTTWKECYQRLCQVLNGLDAAKFDSLPDDAEFNRWFKREAPKRPGQKRAAKCMGCYRDKFGTVPDVRAKVVSGKAYFSDSDKIVHRLLVHFGVEAARFGILSK